MRSHSLTLVLSLAVGACAATVGACGSSVQVVGGSHGDDAGVTTYAPDAGLLGLQPTTGSSQDASVEAMAPATVYQGSPLCNASPATSCCYPDDLRICAPTACEAPSDAGTVEASGGYALQAPYGCHVASAPARAYADATSGAGTTRVTPACVPAGLGLDGVPCLDGQDCAAGYECVGAGVCRHYCCAGNSACLLNQFCDIQQTTQGAMNVPVCMPMRQCDVMQPQSCPAGQTCAVVREDGSESCVAIGSAVAGASCETEHCAAGLVCLGATTRTCYALCAMRDPQCPAGQSCKGGPPLFVDPGVGICQ
jgi:hypothetical protein